MSKRRDAGRPRGEPIAKAILMAALEELADHGIEGASIPRIAQAAEVNKTTIYRRWPTLEDLIVAALKASLEEVSAEFRDTGSLRGDLEVAVEAIVRRVGSKTGRALTRAAMSERSDELIAAMHSDPAAREQAEVAALIQRAVARGEWSLERHRPDAVLAMLTGAVMHRLLIEKQPADAAWKATVIDVVVQGLAAG